MPSYPAFTTLNVIADGSSIEVAPNQGSAFYLTVEKYWRTIHLQVQLTDADGQTDIQHMIWARTRENGIWVPLLRVSPIETFVELGGIDIGYIRTLAKKEHFGAVYDLLAIKQDKETPTCAAIVVVSQEALLASPSAYQLTAGTNIAANVTPVALTDGVMISDGTTRAAALFDVSGATVGMTLELWGLLEGLGAWYRESSTNITAAGAYILTANNSRLLHYSRLAIGVSAYASGTVDTAMISQGEGQEV